MKLTSVRTRLTLWNVGIVALIVTCLVAAIHYTARLNLISGIDQELEEAFSQETRMTRNYLERDPGGGRPGGGFSPGGPGIGFGRGSEGGRGGEEPGEARPEEGDPEDGEFRPFPPRRWPGPPPEGRWRRLRQPFLQPGIFDLKGAPLNPMSVAKPWSQSALSRSLKGEKVLETTLIENAPVRLISGPVRQGGKVVSAIQLVRPLDELNELVDNLSRTILVLILPALAVAGLCGAFLTDRSLRPVRQISKATSELAATNLSLRLPVKGDDEFSELAGNFNRMTERLEEAFASLESAFQQQRRFTADASHELRTPLTAIKVNTSMALSGRGSLESYRRALEEADAAANDMNRIVEDLLFLARSDNNGLRLTMKTFPAQELLEVAAAEAGIKRNGPPIRVLLPDPTLQMLGEPHHLKRLLKNLLENAIRHTSSEDSIIVSAESRDEGVILKVEDTGEGIPPEHLPHVFDRFYRVDTARSREDGGAGLGLSICQSIVQAHSGEIDIQSRPNEGTMVTITLPGEPVSETTSLLEQPSSI